MGWLSMPLSSMHPHTTAKTYLDAQLTYEHVYDPAGERVNMSASEPAPEGYSRRGLRVISSSCLRNRVYYAAVAPLVDGEAGPPFAVVCLVRWNPRAKDGYVFAYKDMDETAGPCEDECPERILSLLGETDNPAALHWRRRCIRNLARTARKLEDGMRIRFPQPIKFVDGHEGTEFVIRKGVRSTALALTESGPARYRVTNLARMTFAIVPQTKVHRTQF